MDYKHRVPGNKRSKRTVNLFPIGWFWPLAGAAVALVVTASWLSFHTEDETVQSVEKRPATTSTALQMPPPVSKPPTGTPSLPKGLTADAPKQAKGDPAQIGKENVATQKTDSDARRDAVNETGALIPPPKPAIRFTFYKILPEKEVIIQESEIKSIKHDEKIGNVQRAEQYLIQVGSYNTQAEAEKVKAQLSTLKIRSKVETMRLENSEWHRVKIGPFDKLNDADKVRDFLKEHQIATVIQKSTTR